MFGLGMQELMIIMVIVVVLFGATRLPQLGSGIGQAIRNFKQGVNEANNTEIEESKEKSKA
jgi:sec-independent protein translocase protein TatA